MGVAADRVIELLRSGLDGEAPVPGLEWTVAACGAHLVTAIRDMAGYVAGTFTPPSDEGGIAVVNDRRIEELDERDPSRLADLLERSCRAFLHEVEQRPAEHPVPWYQPDVSLDVASLTGVALGELIIHGQDIARSVGTPWPIERNDALLVILGTLPLLPTYVDTDRAGDLTARYGLRLRGGPRIGLAFTDGVLTIDAPASGRFDCHLSADPVTYLLVAYGRRSQWSGILTGGLVAWGRRPWLGLRFAELFRRP